MAHKNRNWVYVGVIRSNFSIIHGFSRTPQLPVHRVYVGAIHGCLALGLYLFRSSTGGDGSGMHTCKDYES